MTFSVNCNRQDKSDFGSFDDRTEGIIKVDPFNLIVSFATRRALKRSTDPLVFSLVLNTHRDPTTFM